MIAHCMLTRVFDYLVLHVQVWKLSSKLFKVNCTLFCSYSILGQVVERERLGLLLHPVDSVTALEET